MTTLEQPAPRPVTEGGRRGKGRFRFLRPRRRRDMALFWFLMAGDQIRSEFEQAWETRHS